MENLTASAFSSVPSWKVMPRRSLNVYWRPSFEMVQDSARPGTICVLSSGKVTRVSTMRRPTRFELRSVTWGGSRLTGSATSPTTSVPAGWAATGATQRARAIVTAMIDARARLGVIMSLRVGRRTTSRNITLHAVPAQVRACAGRAKDMARPSSEVCIVRYRKKYEINLPDRDTRVARHPVSRRPREILDSKSGRQELTHACLHDARGKGLARALVRAGAEGEVAAARPERLETTGIRIRRGVAIGRRQDGQDRIAFLHLPSEELARACEEAARVLDGRVVSKYLLNDVAEKVRIARDLLAGARVRDQGQDGIAEKPGGRFVGLGEKANAVG